MALNPAFRPILAADPETRRGLFATTAQRLGTSERNVEKDFWVCLTIDALFNGLPRGPRLLFKGGTSLSKAYGLIDRFSEDIDVTVFRDDLGHPDTDDDLADMSGNKRKAWLEKLRADCRAYITGDLRAQLTEVFAELIGDGPAAALEVDGQDASGQTLLVHYPTVTAEAAGYIPAVVRIESGARSALDPHSTHTLRPYVEADLPETDLAVPNVVTVNAQRTFWDKVVILHGLRRGFENKGVLRQEGNRVSRHYYDLHQMMTSQMAGGAIADLALGEDCVRHSRLFFNRPENDLDSAKSGTFALMPVGEMYDRLLVDYRAMSVMIFGEAPSFETVSSSIAQLEARLNAQVAPT